ncbi:bifunctional serine/threonine-protein kinase/formylglycine-generating enzyme family protein, partial [Phormidium sp. CCY1219]|uniref:bifunctional serine/threonine-protein kinase/formylglycine-generating enzyme family protein n=1 Tax=Phormidium sp. CCY1219 TaxID=2886104 RepID=UPI002D1E7EAC
MTVYCLNPACPKPENPEGNQYCNRCGTQLTPVLRDRYRIDRPLGSGGFGKTYLAKDTDRRDAVCVVKQFAPTDGMSSNPQLLEKALELFEREADRLLHLEEHPQIPTLYAYFQQSNYLYLVQQYIPGQTLLEQFQAEGTFDESKIRALLQDLLPTLHFIHQQKVIHRDIKPENIIRRRRDNKLVLIDFGVAKQSTITMQTPQNTCVKTKVGTPGYAPMEQLMRGVAYPASDLYSLAVTCVRLMTGCFLELDSTDKLYDSIEGCWKWREQLPSGVEISQNLAQVLDKLLSDYPNQRYQSALEVLDALNPPLKFSFEVITVNRYGKAIDRQQREAEYFTEDLGQGIGLEMVRIPAGTFRMGSPETESGRDKNESPQHRVKVPEFFIGKYPVIQAQWQAVMGNNPSYFIGENLPVENVSWHDAVEFCERVSQKTGRVYRLPREAEWEYACRAGTTTPFHFGATMTPELANYNGNYPYAKEEQGEYRKKTTPVGSFPPNAFGLYDMHGNVWEWCQDVWHDNYNGAPSDGSAWDWGGDSGYRMRRGGSWNFIP